MHDHCDTHCSCYCRRRRYPLVSGRSRLVMLHLEFHLRLTGLARCVTLTWSAHSCRGSRRASVSKVCVDKRRTSASLCGLYPGENHIVVDLHSLFHQVGDVHAIRRNLTPVRPASFRYGFITFRRLLTLGLGCAGSTASMAE